MSIDDLTQRRTRTVSRPKLDAIIDKLGAEGLERLISCARNTEPPVGWRTIARILAEETGVTVTHETVRAWHDEMTAPRQPGGNQ